MTEVKDFDAEIEAAWSAAGGRPSELDRALRELAELPVPTGDAERARRRIGASPARRPRLAGWRVPLVAAPVLAASVMIVTLYRGGGEGDGGDAASLAAEVLVESRELLPDDVRLLEELLWQLDESA